MEALCSKAVIVVSVRVVCICRCIIKVESMTLEATHLTSIPSQATLVTFLIFSVQEFLPS